MVVGLLFLAVYPALRAVRTGDTLPPVPADGAPTAPEPPALPVRPEVPAPRADTPGGGAVDTSPKVVVPKPLSGRKSERAADPDTGRASVATWRVEEGAGLLDAARVVTLSLQSARGAAATLRVTCRGRRLQVRLAWSRRLADAALRVRVGDGRDHDDRRQWTLLPDSLGVAYRGDPRRFFRALLAVRTWVAVATTRSGREVAEFDVAGLTEAAAESRMSCGWS